MKIRTIFVSNSSSSSSVVCVPDGFDLKRFKQEIEKLSEKENSEIAFEDVEKAFQKLISKKELWKEETPNGEAYVLSEFFHKKGLVVSVFDTGPDAGQIAVATVGEGSIVLSLNDGLVWQR